jgi:hypothetical protein
MAETALTFGKSTMSRTLDQFAADCRRILAADSGLEGRERVRALLGEVCSDAAFVATYLSDHVSVRQILYEDPELGFCIVGHVEGLPGKARRVRDYTLKPGSAHVYNEGDVHSPWRNGPTRPLRVEGRNLEHIYSAFFEAI